MAQAQWLEMFAGLFSNGVMAGQLNTYTTTTTSALGISVASGRAMIQGFLARSDAAVALTCATADPTNPRIDRAVLHADLTAHTLSVILLTGTPGVSPSPPALTQTTTVWEVSLYQIRVNALQTTLTGGSLTDERTYSLANIPTGAILDAMMANQKVNRSGDTISGGLILIGTLSLGAAVGGLYSQLTYFAPNNNLLLQTPQSGAGNGIEFTTWTGGAGVVPFSIGGQFTGAQAWIDNNGNLTLGGQLNVGTAVGGSSSELLFFPANHELLLQTPQAGAANGLTVTTWNGAAGVVPFSAGASSIPGATSVNNAGTLTAVAGQSTAGSFGVPMIVAQTLAQSIGVTTLQNIVAFTPPTNGLYRCSFAMTFANGSNSNLTAQVTFTDPYAGGPTVRFTNGALIMDGTNTFLATGGVTIQTNPIVLYAAGGSAITIQFRDPSGTPADHVTGWIERLS